MKQLPKNCYCSDFSVYPNNWSKSGASIKKDWYIQYYFHDPAFKNNPKYRYGKLCIVKGGINRYKSLTERRRLIPIAIETELEALELGYNPITNKKKNFLINPSVEELSSNTTLLAALQRAYAQLKISDSTKFDIKSLLKYVEQACDQLYFTQLPVSQVRRKHIRLILDQCEKIKSKWSASTFNHYRAYLMMLFKELVELDVVDINPVKDISKMKMIKKFRKVMTIEERVKVDKHLQEKYPSFHTFSHIFFHSGARLTELMRLQGKHVDLKNQTYFVLIKKGKEYREVKKTIKDIALPLWQEIMNHCNPEDYLFSRDLKPGKTPIRKEQITKRWLRLVKKPLGIEADFYSLKHLNTDETAALLGIQDAAAQNSHTTTAITLQHYAIGEKERQHQRLKQVGNKFA